jgi:hypothetical protein
MTLSKIWVWEVLLRNKSIVVYSAQYKNVGPCSKFWQRNPKVNLGDSLMYTYVLYEGTHSQ